MGTQQQTLLTSCWRRPRVKPNSREPAGISPARHWVWTQELLRILWCSQSDNYSQNNLAKFDNVLDMKVEETRIVLYFYYQPGTYHTNLAIWKVIQCLPNLFSWKILGRGWNHIFQVTNWQKFTHKSKTVRIINNVKLFNISPIGTIRLLTLGSSPNGNLHFFQE